MAEASVTRRDFLKLAGLSAFVGLTASCGLGPKEDLPMPESGFMPVEPGGKLPLEVNGEYGLVSIKYGKNVDKLFARNGEKDENDIYGFEIQRLMNGQTTRRQTGEILDTRIVRLTPAPGVPEKGVVVYDTAGEPAFPKDQEVTRIEPGQTVEALEVVTWFFEGMWQDENALYEVNGGQTPVTRRPEKFTNGWAVGVVESELDNPNLVFNVRGFVPNNKVLVSSS